MILSEEQARTKRCQESFGDTNLGSGAMESRPYVGVTSQACAAISTSPQFCIGSGCMAWRWYDGEPAADEPSCRGYCGKAGRPSP